MPHEMEFVEVDSMWTCAAADMRRIDAYTERFPASLRERFASTEHYEHGAVRMEDLQFFTMGRPPCPSRSDDVDWLWYDKKYCGFPITWRRAFGPDPAVYDATFLIGVLSRSLGKGECIITEAPVTRADFMNLVRYGPRSWQREVLDAARWMPCNQAVHITESGLDLLMRIAPLRLRKALRMADAKDEDDSEDLLMLKVFDGCGMRIMNGYKEDETRFLLQDVAVMCGASKKKIKLFVKENPQHLQIISPDSIPHWGPWRRAARPAGSAAPQEASKGPVQAFGRGPKAQPVPDAAAAAAAAATVAREDETRVAASVEAANLLAREARA